MKVGDKVLVLHLGDLLDCTVEKLEPNGITTTLHDDKRFFERQKVVQVVDGTLKLEGKYGSLYATSMGIKRLECQNAVFSSDVYLDENPELMSLQGSPQRVGSFDCCDTGVTDLKGCPKHIDGELYVCNGLSYKYLPEHATHLVITYGTKYEEAQFFGLLRPLHKFDLLLIFDDDNMEIPRASDGVFRTKLRLILEGHKKFAHL